MIVGHQRSQDLIQRGKAKSLQLSIYASTGTPVLTALGSSFSLYNASNTAVIAGAAITVSGQTATYALGASTLDAEDYGPGWREEWALIVDGALCTFQRPAALVRLELFSTLQPADLVDLASDLPQLGTWTVGGETTTWDTFAWLKLNNAWNQVLRLLWQDGRLPARITSLSLDGLQEALTMLRIYEDLTAQVGDRYEAALIRWSSRVEAIKAGAILDYDLDDDGQPDVQILGIGTAPRTLQGGWPGWSP